MMAMLLMKLYNPTLYHNSSKNLVFSCLLCTSTPKSHSVVEYLVSALGFSSEEATKALKSISDPPMLSQVESVFNFLKRSGFDDTQIKKLVSSYPRYLHCDIDKSLKPKFKALHDLGFSSPDIAHLLITTPTALRLNFEKNLLPKIRYWIGLLGSIESLTKLLRRNQWFLNQSLQKRILPNVSMLREWGVSENRIGVVVKNRPSFILQKTDVFKLLMDEAEKLGVPRSSGLFLWAIVSLQMINKAALNSKFELMKSLGWSEKDCRTAFCKNPMFLTSSEKVMKKKMEFLVNEAGCEPSYVAEHSVLMSLSLEKRLIPRHQVLQILRSRGLFRGEKSLATIMVYTDKKFMEDFVLRHKQLVPELEKIYTASAKSKESSTTQF